MNILEDESTKKLRSKTYNFNFCKKTGYFERWGNTLEDNPSFSPFGPELIDIELTDICYGPGGIPCSWCYKANLPNNTSYMSFETYKQIFDNLPKDAITQIAFGVDAQCVTNPDWYKIFTYTRDNGVIPNVTVADINQDTANKLASICGSVAVSRYEDKELCYNSIEKLENAGCEQINIHLLVADYTKNWIYETFLDYVRNEKLKNLNAIVLLSLKQKGRGIKFNKMCQGDFNEIVEFAINNRIPIGFDSCSCSKFLNCVKEYNNYKQFEQVAEPCESSCFSLYINTNGFVFPCSFLEEEEGWKRGIDMKEVEEGKFLEQIWFSKKIIDFRKRLLYNNRECPYFKV